MNDVIQKLSSFVENQFGKIDESELGQEKKSTKVQNTKDQNMSFSKPHSKFSESSKIDAHSDIHKAMDDVYSEVKKIANASFDFPPLENKQNKESTVVQTARVEQRKGNKLVNHEIELKKKKEEYSRNNMIYRP